MFNACSLPEGYRQIVVNPRQIWKPSLNMIYWPTLTRIRSFLELRKFRLISDAAGDAAEQLVIETASGRFEIHVKHQSSVGRGSRRVPVVMGPFTADTPPEIRNLEQELADLFVKGKKVDWQGPENLRGWWE